MIEEKTVLIIGAGASKPYGFPTGLELREKISYNDISKLLIKYLIYNNQTPFPDIDSSNIQRQYEEFKNVFYRSSTSSIDLFLSRNNKFLDIGKFSIISVILESEKKSIFREAMDRNYDWYSYLYQKMTNTLTTSKSYKDFKNNNISFITFNYDRSLEYFLYDSFINSFYENNIDKSIKDSKIHYQDLIPFPIIHIYGKINSLPWQDKEGLEYGSQPNYSIYKLKENIRVINERFDDEIEIAKKLIKEASKIFFLGFAYAEENMQVLEIPDILNFNQKIYGTAYNFTPHEISELNTIFHRKKDNNNKNSFLNVGINNCDCLSLLRTWLS